MTKKEMLEQIKNFFSNNTEEKPAENVEQVKNVLTPEEKMMKLEYIEKSIELASDDVITSVYDTIFAEVGELPSEEEAPVETPTEEAKEEIVENAHIEAEAILEQEKNEMIEIKNQIENFSRTIEELRNQNKELKNEIEALGNKPSGNVVKVIENRKEMTDLEKKIEELHNKRHKK